MGYEEGDPQQYDAHGYMIIPQGEQMPKFKVTLRSHMLSEAEVTVIADTSLEAIRKATDAKPSFIWKSEEVDCHTEVLRD